MARVAPFREPKIATLSPNTRGILMKNYSSANLRTVMVTCAAVFAAVASPARAEWSYGGGEGSSYAFTTDGGFVDGSYSNGMMFYCPDDGNPCELRVTVNGETPQPRAIVTFAFSNGQAVQRLAEEINGGMPQISWEGEVLEGLLSQDSVAVSIGNDAGYAFSLSGSSSAIRRAMHN